ncbi:MAG: alkaline phosphatase family protein [Chloroflexota bacterium]
MRTVIIGFDAYDPTIFERLCAQGKLPNLARYAAPDDYPSTAYERFSVTDPPQSEVSWTSIATGLNPGGHGIFDFVHRDPATYALSVSLLTMKEGLGGTTFAPPYTARTVFDYATSQGYPATMLWWPAMFPARRGSPVRTLPGLGTPDLLGRLGVGTFFSNDPARAGEQGKIPVRILGEAGKNRFKGAVEGPSRKKGSAVEPMEQSFELERTGKHSARLTIGKQRLNLRMDEWSPIVELSFRTSLFFSVRAVTRVILTSLDSEVALYFLPLQIHPLKSPWPYGTPGGFVKESWNTSGPFLTLGWPQDTTALEEKRIGEEHFLELCQTIVADRERVLTHHLNHFQEGILGCVFDTLDRVQHMFLRSRPDLVDEWYMQFDQLFGRIEQRLAARGLSDKTRLIVLSDHGFTGFDYKVHLNRWLVDEGYLYARDNGDRGELSQVDWSRSKAYAIGLNSIYLNLAGREGQGIVSAAEKEQLARELSDRLQQWRGPDGLPVVARVQRQEEAFDGPLAAYGPDLVVGYAPGHRASQDTGLGKWGAESITTNHDQWAADHCMDASAVPGVIFANQGLLANFSNPSYRDIPALAADAAPDDSGSEPPPTQVHDDEKALEERLKGLGYL